MLFVSFSTPQLSSPEYNSSSVPVHSVKLALWNGIRDVFARGRGDLVFNSFRRPLDIAANSCFPPISKWNDNYIVNTDPLLPSLPTLPAEIWRRIISYTVRLSGARSIDLEDPFAPPYINEEYPEIDPQLFVDRRAVQAVCRSWRAVATEIAAEYLAIYSEKELLATIKVLEASEKQKKKKVGKALGERTTRIDFKILGTYSVANIVRLLQFTPNLLIYVNKNGNCNVPEKSTPTEVINALVRHCGKSLLRAEWSGPGEPPTYHQLVTLTHGTPNLLTLRLTGIFSYPLRVEIEPPNILPLLSLPKLKTLSLGMIPEPGENRLPNFSLVWDPFLVFLTVRRPQLPCLERFEIDIFPIPLHPFFVVHGPKIKMFRVTTWSIDTFLPDTLAHCPNVESLVLSHGSDALELPTVLPNIKRICILPTVEETVGVPEKVFTFAVLAPLDQLLMAIEKITAPGLEELRIRNSGAFVNLVDHSTWLHGWWLRWNIRRVHFRDKSGRSYENIEDVGELLLDTVRA